MSDFLNLGGKTFLASGVLVMDIADSAESRGGKRNSK